MFGKFDHQTIRRYTAAFGHLFSNINISRYDQNGTVVKNIKVPIHNAAGDYAIKRALEAPLEGEEDEAGVKFTLPLISYEMGGLAFDSIRNTHRNIKIPVGDFQGSGQSTTRDYMFNRVPYIFDFEVSLAAETVSDANQMLEQILPYFQPTLSITVQDVINRTEHIKSDTVITLDGVTKNDNWENQPDEDRIVSYVMNFSVKGYLYMPVKNIEDIIMTVEINYGIDPDDPDNLIVEEQEIITEL